MPSALKHTHTLSFGFTLLVLSFAAFDLLAGNDPLVHQPVSNLYFEENKNQWPAQVKYQADIPGGSLFFEQNTLTFLQAEEYDFHGFHTPNPNNDPVTLKFHAYKVNFLNSNSDVQISGTDRSSFIRNYYRGNDPSHWAENVNVYEAVQYKNLYSNVDVKFYTSEHHLKYDVIILPGGDPAAVKMDYAGTDGMTIEYGHLNIKTSLGITIEEKPYAYQDINGSRTEIPCSYVLSGTTLGFSVGSYDPAYPLIIDPTLIAATYTGSTADNWGYTATFDAAGNIYSAGIAASNGYPATVGAFQTTFQGGGAGGYPYPFDIAIIKYNPTGTTKLFATYYGGMDNEQPHSTIVNSAGQLFVVGRTYSSNFPTMGAYDNTYNGGADIIIGKFNGSGQLLASTFIGGTSDDCVNYASNFFTFGSLKFNYADDGRSEIILDGAGNVYVAANTQSSNFPTASAYDATFNGIQDGVVFKMNSSLSALTFSTFLGGSNYDAAYGLKLDNSNNIYVCGGTASTDFPTTAGVLYPTYQGGTADGFVSVLSSSGNSLLRSTFLGTAAYDQAYLIENDASNNIYIFGQTRGAYPVAGAGVYSNPNSAQFIHKMAGTLASTVFSTVIGTGSLNPNISPTAFLVDSCESIYIAGWGRCSAFGHPNSNTVTGMPITANAIQPTTDGCDFYFMMLKPDAKGLMYATYYGENGGMEPDHVDGGTSRFDTRAFIYQSVCGSCGGTDNFPTMPGAWSTTNNSSNCNNAVVKIDMSIKPVAVANLAGPNAGCAPFTVTINNTGSQGSDFIWDFGDGSPITTVPAPSHTYTAAGTYTMTLYAIDSLGICQYIDTATLVIYVGLPPVLTMAQTNILCNGANNGTATVSATGGLAPLTYSWNNGQTSSAAVGLSATGYTVTVTDALGCASTKTVLITQPPPLTLSLTPTATTCGNNNGAVTASSGGGVSPYSYSWTGGSTASAVSGLASGTYSVLLTDANGCTRTASASVGASTSVNATTSSTDELCGSSNGTATANPTGGITPYTYSWNNGQTAPTATGLSGGNYSVTVSDAAGCTFSATVTVNVNGAPVAQAGPDVTICAGGSVQLNASGGITYSWTPSSGLSASNVSNPVANPGATTNYTVTVTNSFGCTDTDDLVVTVDPVPVPAFLAPPVCENTQPAVFTDQSAGASSWSWNFGDPGSGANNSSSLQNPTHTYPGPGTYSVTLVATSGAGCVDSLTQTITINPKPVPSFTASTVCFNNPTLFTDLSGGNPVQWAWNFGDGNSDTQQNPAHTYNAAGSYTVTLAVTNSFGCKDSFSAVVVVNPLPAAGFSSTTVCIGDPACFTDLTTISSGNIGGWSWNFGDPNSGTANISNAQNPCHTYTAGGTYNVILTATSNNGCQSTIQLTASVNPPPVAGFTVNAVCLNSPTNFFNTSTNAIQSSWNFGDGGTSNLQNPSHTYLAYGTYIVTLIVTSGGTCTDTIMDTVTVNPIPVVSFIADSVCLGETTSFLDLSFVPSGSISSWSWNFGDGTTSTQQHPTHQYSSPGTYNVTLTVTANTGCISVLAMNTVVYALPVADFSITPGTMIGITDVAQFNDLSAGGVVSWSWQFGDGDSSSLQNPTHSYSDTGTYIITLIVMNSNGCVDTVRYPIEIQDYTFYIPNAFTPNGNDVNDFFFGVGLGIVEYELFIFDRWGNRIFYCKVNDLPQSLPCRWNGKVDSGASNEIVEEDVYVWKVNLVNIYKNKYTYIGHVSVVR